MWEIKLLNLMCWEVWIVPKRGGNDPDPYFLNRCFMHSFISYDVLYSCGVGDGYVYALLLLEEVRIRM